MLARIRSRLTYANVMATVAVFIALGGSSYAALRITSRNVPKDALTGADIKNLTGKDVRNNSLDNRDVKNLLASDFKAGQLPAGPQGAKGDKGDDGSDASINGVAAGGALEGAYPNPTLAPAVVVPDSFSTSAFPTIRAINTGNQVVANNTFPFVHLQGNDHRRAINHDTGTTNAADCSTPDFDAPGDCFAKVTQPGTYLVTGSVTWASNANGIRILDIDGWTSNLNLSFALGRDERKPVAGSTLNPNPTTTQTLSTVHQLTTGQSVSMRAYQDSGADLAVFGATDDSTRAALTVTWLSPGA